MDPTISPGLNSSWIKLYPTFSDNGPADLRHFIHLSSRYCVRVDELDKGIVMQNQWIINLLYRFISSWTVGAGYTCIVTFPSNQSRDIISALSLNGTYTLMSFQSLLLYISVRQDGVPLTFFSWGLVNTPPVVVTKCFHTSSWKRGDGNEMNLDRFKGIEVYFIAKVVNYLQLRNKQT